MKAIIIVGLIFSLSNCQSEKTSHQVKKIKVGDVELAYVLRGKGKPLIMINGYKCTLSMWDPELLAEMEKNNLLILFDNRGVGLSSDTPENHTSIAQMADDAAGLAQALGYKEVYALGWSMGARIAQQMAIRHPETVEKLILSAPNPGGSHQVVTNEEVEKQLNGPEQSKEKSIEMFFGSKAENIEAAHNYIKRIADAVKAKEIPNDFTVSKQTVERQNQARGGNWNTSNENYDALSKLTMPVLITDGKEDIIDLPGNVNVIAEQIPFSWVAFFEGGHAYMFEEQKRFAALVNVFLN